MHSKFLLYVTGFSFPYFCPYEGFVTKAIPENGLGKGYNTREKVRASTLVINLAFSGDCGLYEDKIYQLLNTKNFVLSEYALIVGTLLKIGE